MSDDRAPVEAENQPAEPTSETVETEELSQDPWNEPEEATSEKADIGDEAEAEPEKAEEAEQEHSTVSHAALHEERQRRQEEQAANNEMREKIARMEERFAQVVHASTPQEPVADFDDDPAAYLKQQADEQTATMAEMKQTQDAQNEANQQQARFNNFMNNYGAQAKQYEAAQSDFPDAYKYLADSRRGEYEAMGMDQTQINEYMRRDEIQVAVSAMEQGINPAERMYEIAKLRGYALKANPGGGGETTTPAQVKLDTIAKGQEKATSTIAGPSGKTETPMTLEKLADLEGAEFDAAWDKQFGSAQNIYT